MSNPFGSAGSDAASAIARATGIQDAGNTLRQGAAGGATANVSHNTAIWVVLGAGLVMVVLADFAPHIVNGVLLLILAGVILKRSDVWIPYLNGTAQGLKG